jgi:hypothetical protein
LAFQNTKKGEPEVPLFLALRESVAFSHAIRNPQKIFNFYCTNSISPFSSKPYLDLKNSKKKYSAELVAIPRE